MNNENGKSSIVAVIVFFILLFLFSKFGPSIPISILSQEKGQPLVSVGEGKTTAVPDIANISLGIEESSSSLTDAEKKVNTKSKAIADAIKKLGIDPKDIETTSYNVYPNYDYEQKPPKITGYQVSTSYSVKVRDFEKINDVIATVTQLGATNVGNINFEVSDEIKNKLLDEARQKAVNDAKEKAQSLAKASGVTLGKIINISETTNSSVPPIRMMVPLTGGVDLNQTKPDIQPGQSELSVSVSISFEIR